MSLSCEEALTALALTPARPEARGESGVSAREAQAHLAGCAGCQAEQARARAVAEILTVYPVAEPGASARARTLAAAAPMLARRAAEVRGVRRRVAWALTLALLPLPVIVLANVKLLVAAHALLLTVLPPVAALYLVLSVGAGVALLLALSYVAVPLLATRRPLSSLPLPSLLEESDVHVRV